MGKKTSTGIRTVPNVAPGIEVHDFSFGIFYETILSFRKTTFIGSPDRSLQS